MRKRLAPLAFFVGILAVAAIACSSSPPPTPPPQPQSPPPPPAAQAPAPPAQSQPGQSAQPAGSGGSQFTVNLQDPGGSGEYMFDPADLTFKVGDTVEFTFTSETQFHTFTVDDLDIDVEVDGGETVTLSYTFENAGEFSLVCIPHEFLGMVGTVTVQ